MNHAETSAPRPKPPVLATVATSEARRDEEAPINSVTPADADDGDLSVIFIIVSLPRRNSLHGCIVEHGMVTSSHYVGCPD